MKQEMEHDEIFEGTWEAKKTNGCHIFKMTYYQLLSVMLDIFIWKNAKNLV